MTQTKMKKLIKILAIALTGIGLIVMLVAGTVFLANSEKVTREDQSVVLADTSGTCGDNLTWTLTDEGVLTISGTGAMTDYSYRGPWSSDVKEVIIENGVTSIGSYAFYWCRSLTSIEIPSGVTSIGDNAFSYCSSLTSIEIPSSVTSIGDNAFSACESLTSINIQNGITSIEDSTFSSCISLTSITIPNSVTSIGEYAFSSCYGLTSITIPNSVEIIGSYAFYQCRNLSSVVIGSGVRYIDSYAFYVDPFGHGKLFEIYNLSDLPISLGNNGQNYGNITSYAKVIHTSLSEPSIITTDPNGYQFAYFNTNYYFINYPVNETSIVLPETFDFNGTIVNQYKIPQRAFYYSYGLTSIHIPSSVIDIENYTFNGYNSNHDFISITVDSGNTKYNDGNGKNCLIETVTRKLIKGSVNSVIPNSVKIIDDYAFLGSDITSISIPSSVESIGYEAFYQTSLESVSIDGGIIGYRAFSECYNLTSLTLSGATSIGEYAFSGCKGLTSLNISSSVESIGNQAFYNCTGLRSITIGNGVTSIGNNAFGHCYGFTTINIPGSVTSIGADAFSYCRGLRNVTLNNGLTSIGVRAFTYCTNLRSITIPNSVTTIGDNAFDYCNSLVSLNIPGSVTSIGNNIISNCTSLNILTVDPSNSTYNDGNGGNVIIKTSNGSIIAMAEGSEIPNTTTLIGEGAFANRKDLTEIFIPYGVTSIGNSAFAGCSNLKSIVIPNSVISIGNNAFDGCSSLSEINIPNSVTSMGTRVFKGCSSLTSLTIPGSVQTVNALFYLSDSEADGMGGSTVGVKKIILENGIKVIGTKAFFGCRSLTSIQIPNSVTSIASYAFGKCENLVSLNIPNGVTYLSYDVFTYLSQSIKLNTVTIGSGLTNFSYDVFSSCSNIIINENNPNFLIEDGVLYNKDKTKLLKFYQQINGNTTFTIPNTVTSIESNAFSGCKRLTSIEIPNSLTTISENAFSDCRSLISISIPSSVTSIGGNAFNNCSSLTSINIPSSVTSIGNSAFYGCSNLESVNIESGLITIGWFIFGYCSSLTSITIPNSVEIIDTNAFYNCSSLTSINIPSSVTSIDSSIFSECSSLTSITVDSNNQYYSSEGGVLYNKDKTVILRYPVGKTGSTFIIPNSVTYIGDSAFSNCINLTSINIPDGVTSIGSSAFYRCRRLTSVTISNGVERIGYSSFEYSGLTSIHIPSSVTYVSDSAFYDCSNLQTVTVDSENSTYNDGNGSNKIIQTSNGYVIFEATGSAPTLTYGSCGSNLTWLLSDANVLTISGTGDMWNFYQNYNQNNSPWCDYFDCIKSVVIENGVTSIGNAAFAGCSNLKSIEIPSSVRSIGDGVFYGCDGLKSITLPNGVTSIGSSVFSGCSSLTSIEIPNSVISIGNNAFSSCNLKSIEIPSSVESVGHMAFGSSNIDLLIISNNTADFSTPFWNTSIKTLVINGRADGGNFFYYETVDSIVIGKDVTNIGGFIRYVPSSLASITVDSDNQHYSSDGGVLYNKDKTVILRYPVGKTGSTFIIPNSVTSIGSSAFSGCISLTSINIPSSVTSIGSSAFSECRSLTSIEIPNSATSIGSSAFSECSSLTSIEIPNSVTSIGSSAFYNCISLTSIEIPNSITSIGSSAFSGCSSLISINIPSSVTSIGDSAFYGCSSLTSISIPSGVTYIAGYAFSGCISLTLISIPSSVNYIRENAFYGCSGLRSVTFESGLQGGGEPNSLTIESGAFGSCISLTSINIPRNVTNIYYEAFSGCKNIQIITVDSENSVYNDGNGSNCIIQTSTNTLVEGFAVTIIPNTVTSIGYEAFSGSGVTSIEIPYGVTSIEDNAFSWCSTLTSISIPSSVTSIESNAFSGCLNAKIIFASTTVPTISGSVFGWSAETMVNHIYVPNSALSLYLEALSDYAPIIEGYDYEERVNITWQNWEGSLLEEDEVVFGDLPVYSSAAPTRAGTLKYNYEWDGWTTPIELATEDATYTASYFRNGVPYTVTYNSNDGNNQTLTQNVIYHGTFTTYGNNEFVRYGYRIVGWSTDPTSQTGIYSNVYTEYGFEETEDITLYVIWEAIEYTITKTIDGVETAQIYTIESNSITLTNPTKSGYTFLGWTGSNGDEPETTVTIPQGSTGNKAYAANWEIIVYTITYTLNGGEAENPISYTVESAKITLVQPTRAGATFKGWTGSNGSTAQKTVSINAGSTGNKTYTANWTLITYTLKYTLKGGTVSPANPKNFNVETATFTLNNPTKANYDFLGWTGGGLEEPTLEVTIETGSINARTYVANWAPTEYAITYTLNGGITENPETYTVESNTITLVNPSKVGYNFVGWTGSNGEEPQLSVTIPTGSTGNKEYTANWSEPIVYTITYTLNGGTATNPTTYTVESESITLVNPTKAGYTFLGWTGSNGEEQSLVVVISQGSTGNKEYTANFEVITYTITTTVDGVNNTQNYTVESESVTLVNPTKAGYNFVGWTGSNGEEPEVEVVIPQGSTGDKVYTANWSKPIVYTITYTLNGGEAENPTTYTVESNSITLVNPTKVGYTFTGWTGSNGNEPEFVVVIPQGTTGNKEYVANWSLNQYKIILHIDNEVKVINYNILSKDQVIEKPTKKGYNFLGWTGEDLTEATMDLVIPKGSIGDREYTATWEEAPTNTLAIALGVGIPGGTILIAGVVLIVLAKQKKIKLW